MCFLVGSVFESLNLHEQVICLLSPVAPQDTKKSLHIDMGNLPFTPNTSLGVSISREQPTLTVALAVGQVCFAHNLS